MVVFKISKLEESESDLVVVNTIKEKQILSGGFFLFLVDYIYINFLSSLLHLGTSRSTSLVDSKIQQLDNKDFYKFNNTFNILSITQLSLYGLKSI